MLDIGRFPLFVVFGLVCYVSGLAVIYVLTSILGIHYLVSNVLALFVVYPLGFALNKQFNFRTRGRTRRELLRYYIASVVTFVASLAAIAYLVEALQVWYIVANVIVTGAQVLLNFALLDRWVFRR